MTVLVSDWTVEGVVVHADESDWMTKRLSFCVLEGPEGGGRWRCHVSHRDQQGGKVCRFLNVCSL